MSDEKLENLAKESEEFNYPNWRWRFEATKEAETRAEEITAFFDAIYQRGIEVSPFYRRDDITIKFHDFLDDLDKNVFLRMYIPNSRFQSEQFSVLLRTVERYLRQVESRRFSIESRATGSGTLYLFCSAEGDESFGDLEEAFARFDQFMRLCRDDPEQALRLINMPGLSAAESRFLISKYARDYQRIMIDVRHEFEQKILLLSQRFDLEALNFSEEKLSSPMINGGPSMLLNLSGNTGSILLNLGSMSGSNSSQMSQEIGKILNSGVVYSHEDERIIELINNYADRVSALQLRSDLDQAKTPEIPETDRKVARGRIASFLFSLASKAGEEIVKRSASELVEYVLKGLGMST